MDFDGSLNDAKKKYSGKKVKTIRKSKSGDIIGEAVIVNVEELNESEESVVNKFPLTLTSIKKALKNPTFSKGPIEFSFPKSEYYSKDVVKSFQKYFTDKGYKVETGTDHPTTLYFDRTIASKLNESEEQTFKAHQGMLGKSLNSYFETMLWSSTGEDGKNLDDEYAIKDISDKLKEKSKKDLLAFVEYCEKNCVDELEDYLDHHGYIQFGHDFLLSRNGHGAGFFDKGKGYKELQKATKKFGEVDVYVTDDGEIGG
jgi:hypothetical protein